MENHKELLSMAAVEIRSLRRQNEIMRARLDMFDAVMSALHGQPAVSREGHMSPDIVYEIDRYLREPLSDRNAPSE